MSTPFDFINSITDNKKDLFLDPQADKDYISFIVNRGLSNFYDCCMLANEMNKYPTLPKKMQFDFYRFAISKKKRFSKWFKKNQKTDDIKLLMTYFQINNRRAEESLKLLSEIQLEEIRQKYNQGGKSK